MHANHHGPLAEAAPERHSMQQSLFLTLCDICDEFDTYVRDLEPGAVRDHLESLVQRLDDVIDRTIGVECPAAPAEED